jgi:hypothetical protein
MEDTPKIKSGLLSAKSMNRRARSSLANTFIGMPQGTDEKIPEDVPEAFLKNDSSSIRKKFSISSLIPFKV